MPRNALVSRPRAEEVKSDADVRDRRAADPAPVHVAARHDPADAPAVERALLRDGHDRRLRATASGASTQSHAGVKTSRAIRGAASCTCATPSTGAVWSAGYQPAGREADTYEVSYSEDQATFARRDGSITTGLTIMVSAEDDAEIRRVSLTNLGSRARELELTSYQELVLAPQAADVAHPAFQNLFVQTEFDAETGALLATRRPRSNDEERVWAAHVATVEDHADGVIQYETDRARFLGRGRSVRSAACGRRRTSAVEQRREPCSTRSSACAAESSSNRARRCTRSSPPSSPSRVSTCSTWPTSIGLRRTFERARILAWTHAQVQLHHLGIDAGEAQLFQRLANRILYSDPSLRPSQNVLAEQSARERPGSGRTASPATCRSCWSASTSSTTSTSFGSCCGRTSTGASSCSTSIS